MNILAKWVWIILIAILFMGSAAFFVIGASLLLALVYVFVTGLHKKKF